MCILRAGILMSENSKQYHRAPNLMCKYLQIHSGAISKHVHTYQSENLCFYFTTLGFSMSLCTPALYMNTNMYDVCVWCA